MTDGLATRIVLAARPKGKPVDTDFRIEKLPIPKPGAERASFTNTLFIS